MARAIERMIDDEALAATAAAKGVQRAAQFSWRETALKVYGVYQQAMARR